LEAGRRYYLEIRQRQNSGSAHLSVRWRLPDGTEQRPIPAERLASFTTMGESELAQRAQ
jgi:PA14 domain.